MRFLCKLASLRLRQVRSTGKVEPLLLICMKRSQLRIGHLARQPPGCLHAEVFGAWPTTRRPWGRPRTGIITWDPKRLYLLAGLRKPWDTPRGAGAFGRGEGGCFAESATSATKIWISSWKTEECNWLTKTSTSTEMPHFVPTTSVRLKWTLVTAEFTRLSTDL